MYVQRIHMRFSEEHDQLRRTVREFVDKEIRPHTERWERDGIFPAHELFKKAGKLGLLGVNKPEQFGGMGLDYSYQTVVTEELGSCGIGGVAMALGVQTDMATPALARHGSDELRNEFLVPAITGDMVTSIAVSEVERWLRRRGDSHHRAQGRHRLHHRRLEDVDHERVASRLVVPAREHERGQSPSQQVAHHRADEDEGRDDRREDRQARRARVAIPARCFSRTCACRNAIASATRAWAS